MVKSSCEPLAVNQLRVYVTNSGEKMVSGMRSIFWKFNVVKTRTPVQFRQTVFSSMFKISHFDDSTKTKQFPFSAPIRNLKTQSIYRFMFVGVYFRNIYIYLYIPT